MKFFFHHLFLALGIVFLVLLVIGGYFFATDSYGVRSQVLGSNAPDVSRTEEKTTAEGFTLSDDQKRAIEAMGIDSNSVPTSVSGEQESCFIGVLGQARVDEIKNGAVPSMSEYVRAKACI